MTRAALDSVPWAVADSASVRARSARWRSPGQIPDGAADLAGWRRTESDPVAMRKRVRVPGLARFGADDHTVPVAEHVERMRGALAAAGNADVAVRVVPGADHGLFLFGHLVGNDWDWPRAYWAWATKAPGVYEDVGDWLLARSPPTSH